MRDYVAAPGSMVLHPAELQSPGPGSVYTETVVYAAPEQFVSDAPYQLAIISLAAGGRLTGRIAGDRAQIGDPVDFLEFRNGIPFFQKSASAA